MESSIFKAKNLQLSKSKSCGIHITTRDEIVPHVPGTSSQYLWDPMFLVDCLVFTSGRVPVRTSLATTGGKTATGVDEYSSPEWTVQTPDYVSSHLRGHVSLLCE